MDFYSIVQTAIVATFVGSSASVLTTLFSILLTCICSMVSVDDRRRVAVLDCTLGSIGLCSRRRVGPNNPPADGYHFLFLSGPIIAVRDTSGGGFRAEAETRYTLYIFGGRARKTLEKLISGDPTEIMTRWVYNPAPWRTFVTTVRQKAPPNARPWQAPIVAKLCRSYVQTNRSSALITGKPGLGKSRLAELVAVELRRALRVEPVVVKNFDPTARGLILDDVIGCPTQDAPVIIVLDEYDTIIDHAEKKLDGLGEGSSIAKNRSSMLSCLDRLGLMPYIVIIATSNVGKDKLVDAYIRKGRLDEHFEVN